jgi:hypothetical protein
MTKVLYAVRIVQNLIMEPNLNPSFVAIFCRSGNPGIHVQNLLLLLPSVRQADSILRHFWNRIRDEGKVILNKLLVEMLEAQLKMERKWRWKNNEKKVMK